MHRFFSGIPRKLGVWGFGLACLLCSSHVQAGAIFAPSDGPSVIGGQSDGTNFNRAIVGNSGNTFPANESPDHAVDGVNAKYLNFGKTNTGFIVTPGIGSSIAASIKLWTANDSEPRDPSSYQLYGTNSAIPAGSIPMTNFTLISSNPLALPALRSNGSPALIDDNSQTVSFSNSTAYTSYLVLFPDVKTNSTADAMQIGEVQLFTAVPEPGSLALIALGGVVLARRRR